LTGPPFSEKLHTDNERQVCISLSDFKGRLPSKFEPLDTIFGHIRRGDTIFIGSACAEPQHLVQMTATERQEFLYVVAP